MTLHWVILQFGVFCIPLVAGYGFRNCIQKFESEDTFLCTHRLEVNIHSIVSDLPPTTRNITILFNTIKLLPKGSFEHLPNLLNLNLLRNNLQTINPGAFDNLALLNYLDLSYNNISSLSLGAFHGLEGLIHLYLQENLIAVMHPDIFSPLQRLRSLNLSDNCLTNFSKVVQSIEPLKELKNLTLCSNKIRILSHTSRLPSNLTTLFLCKNHLQDLNCHHDFLANITYLDLSYNNMTSSSLQKVNLSNINYLNIASNPHFDILKFLEDASIQPEGIDYSGLNLNTSDKLRAMCNFLRVKNISDLNLIKNGIKNLTKSILENCSVSGTVDLSRNRLKSINCLTFMQESNFKTLIVEHNLLKQLHNCYNKSKFLQLTSISFRYNRIWSVKSNAFTYAPNLKKLNLNINNIIFVANNSFAGLEKLRTLRLDNNLITDLYRKSFQNLKNLEILNLRNNRVSVIFTNVFHDLENLEILDLGGNKITQIKKWSFYGLNHLSKLYLDRNQIKIISGEMFYGVETTLQVLDLMSNQICFESSRNNFSPFSKLQNVYDLKLQNQQPYGLTAIPKGFFTGLTSLRSLYLSQNRLTHLSSDVFDDLRQLTHLMLSEDCNGVQNFSPGIFKNLFNLRILDLENVCLQTLNADIFSNLTNLRRLQLTKNALQHINVTILEAMTSLKYLDLWKCPLTCACTNQELQRWVNHSQVQVVYAYNLTCPDNPKAYFHDFDIHVCDLKIKLTLFCCTFVTLLCLIIMPIVYSKSYWRIKYNYFLFISWLHERWSSDKDLYKYDAFVSYNTWDQEWVYQKMLPMLESYDLSGGLRLCLHHRDFQLGRDIVDNIVDSIHNSRKTLCVVSRSYLQSEWCSMEMQLASYKLFDEMRDVLVLIFLENIPDKELSTYHRMRKVMLKKTYITWPEEPEAQKLFWAKLVKALKGGSNIEDVEDSLMSNDEERSLITS
ncbi:toll-like receptor 13 [Pseudophryne corroboree]|uniref:toll-like receptor 13 n=1 Tax=Pseudophryne corroboree TaxID=495146 RepID=UPI0030816D0D